MITEDQSAAIEFLAAPATHDGLPDFAFLLMDLWRRQLPLHANAIWNEYLAETLDFAGVRLLPLFLSCRSAVRAKTSATAAGLQTDPQHRRELEQMARTYLALAATLLRPPAACVIAIGGFSGSGKSTLARALAPSIGAVPGALVVRSDEIRKRLCGVSPLTRLGPAGYTAVLTQGVYETIVEHADLVVRAEHSVIVDAVFARPADREAIEHVAGAAGVPFVGLWLEGPERMLVERLRRRPPDASDADHAVLRAQLAQGPGSIAWDRIQASADPEEVLRHATAVIEKRLGSPRMRLGTASI